MNTLKLAIQPRSWTLALCLCLAPFAMSAAQAGIFSDNEARQAILDLRSEVKAQGDSKNAEIAKLMEQTEGLHRSLLSLQNQIEELKQSHSQQTGKIEELQKQLQDTKALPTAAASTSEAVGIDISSAAAQTPALSVRLDGVAISTTAAEKKQYDTALGLFQSGTFAEAQRSFAFLLEQYPNSAYAPWAYYWLGNSQYAQKRYADAIKNFKRVIATAPTNPKASEAALSIANSQLEMGNRAEAKRTLENLTKAYPASEAAQIARERLRQTRTVG